MSSQSIDLSIVVPCYGSGSWLAELVDQLHQALHASSLDYEIILINDASVDDTWQAIASLADADERVRGVDLLFNTGQYRATMCGLQQATGELVVTMDDDLQQSPADIPAIIQPLLDDPTLDCVMASIRGRRHGLVRRIGSSLMSGLFRLTYGKPRGLKVSSFRAMRRRLVEAISQFDTARPNINPLVLQSTARINNVEVDHHPRAGGRSGYGIFRLGRLMLDNVLSVSTLPLKAVSVIGLLSALVSVGLGIFYFVRWYGVFINEPGFATIVLLLLFFGGLTLLSIGLLGEYLIRIMDEVRRRPWFVVRQRAGESEATSGDDS